MRKSKLIYCVLSLATIGLTACAPTNGGALKGNYYDIQLWSINKGGTVVFESEKAKADEDFTVSVTPDNGYMVKSFKVNNVECVHLIENGEYVHPAVSERLSFRVTFEAFGIGYLEKEYAPSIDGSIDSVWEDATTLYIDNVEADEGKHVDGAAWTKVFWNEDGLYFLARIEDDTLTNSDRLNIWVSERYTTEKKGYSSNKKDGNYCVSISASNEYFYYSGVNLSDCLQKGVTTFDGGYIVEAFVPTIGEKGLAEGVEIGLDFSIDYYAQDREDYLNKGTEERVSYAYWAGKGYYWSDVGGLCQMTLLK